jgi:ankyrin repeat protein
VESPEDGVLALAEKMFDLAREGDHEQLAVYVDAGAPVNLTNAKGDTLLMLAAYHGHPNTVEALLTRGADTAPANGRSQTALAAAVSKQSAASVTALLAAGADPGLGSPSALEGARFFDPPEMLALLINTTGAAS